MTVQNHIRNPVEWGWDALKGAGHAVGSASHAVHGDDALRTRPVVIRRIGAADIGDALARGVRDFAAYRTDVIFLCLVYPLAGIVLASLAFGNGLLPLVFPLVSGFALLGPVAAIGLYEMSRRREQGMAISWVDAFAVVRSPRFGAILGMAFVLLALFLLWIGAAWGIYAMTLGPEPPASLGGFVEALFTTAAGWAMMLLGFAVGFAFAAAVLAISLVSFPMLLDRDVGLAAAIATSVRATIANPRPVALWGLIVAGGLVLGTIPLLVGLAVVMPILGHATWHLYRKLITR